MIDDYTTNRFVQLTPFKEVLTYNQRNVVNNVSTDTYTTFIIPQSRSRDLQVLDIPADRLGLFAELLNKQTKVFELWSPVLYSIGLYSPNKDDYVTDSWGNSWTIVNILEEFHTNIFTLITVKRN